MMTETTGIKDEGNWDEEREQRGGRRRVGS